MIPLGPALHQVCNKKTSGDVASHYQYTRALTRWAATSGEVTRDVTESKEAEARAG